MINTKPTSDNASIIALWITLVIAILALTYAAMKYPKAYPTVTVITENK